MTLTQITVTGQKFNLGKTLITLGVLAHCEEYGIDYLELTIRHASGDFATVGHLDNANLSRAERQHGAYATDNELKLNTVVS